MIAFPCERYVRSLALRSNRHFGSTTIRSNCTKPHSTAFETIPIAYRIGLRKREHKAAYAKARELCSLTAIGLERVNDLPLQHRDFSVSVHPRAFVDCDVRIDPRAVVSLSMHDRYERCLREFAGKLPLMCVNVSRLAYTTEAFTHAANTYDVVDRALRFYIDRDMRHLNGTIERDARRDAVTDRQWQSARYGQIDESLPTLDRHPYEDDMRGGNEDMTMQECANRESVNDYFIECQLNTEESHTSDMTDDELSDNVGEIPSDSNDIYTVTSLPRTRERSNGDRRISDDADDKVPHNKRFSNLLHLLRSSGYENFFCTGASLAFGRRSRTSRQAGVSLSLR